MGQNILFQPSFFLKIDNAVLCTQCGPESGVMQGTFQPHGHAVSWITQNGVLQHLTN